MPKIKVARVYLAELELLSVLNKASARRNTREAVTKYLQDATGYENLVEVINKDTVARLTTNETIVASMISGIKTGKTSSPMMIDERYYPSFQKLLGGVYEEKDFTPDEWKLFTDFAAGSGFTTEQHLATMLEDFDASPWTDMDTLLSEALLQSFANLKGADLEDLPEFTAKDEKNLVN